MKKLISWLVPKEKKLFGMLAEQSMELLSSAKELNNFIGDYSKFGRSDRKEKSYSIKKACGRIGELNNGIMQKLSHGSVSDRDEIYKVSQLLEDAGGFIGDCALRFTILSIERIDGHTMKLAYILHSMAEELNKAMLDLDKKNMKNHYERLQNLKNEAEEAYNEALSELFHFYKNSIDIMKYREVYELLKAAAKSCEAAAKIVESVVAKYA